MASVRKAVVSIRGRGGCRYRMEVAKVAAAVRMCGGGGCGCRGGGFSDGESVVMAPEVTGRAAVAAAATAVAKAVRTAAGEAPVKRAEAGGRALVSPAMAAAAMAAVAATAVAEVAGP